MCPGDIARELPILEYIKPSSLKRFIYPLFGYTYPGYYNGVIRANVKVAKQIEECVNRALERMEREGKIFKYPQMDYLTPPW